MLVSCLTLAVEEFRSPIAEVIDFCRPTALKVNSCFVITSAQPVRSCKHYNHCGGLLEDAAVPFIDASSSPPGSRLSFAVEGAAGLAHALPGQMGSADVVSY